MSAMEPRRAEVGSVRRPCRCDPSRAYLHQPGPAQDVVSPTSPELAKQQEPQLRSHDGFLKKLKTSSGQPHDNIYEAVLDSMSYGLPQKHLRLYVVGIEKVLDRGFRFPHPVNRYPVAMLEALLETPAPNNFYSMNLLPKQILATKTKLENMARTSQETQKAGINPFASHHIVDLCAGQGKRFTVGHLPTLTASRCSVPGSYFDLRIIQALSLREICRAQGFEMSRFNLENISDSQWGKMCGNATSVNVAVALMSEMLAACPAVFRTAAA